MRRHPVLTIVTISALVGGLVGGIVGALQAHATAATTISSCGTLTSPLVKQWDFSADGHETLHNAAADYFHTTTQHPGVTYNGSSATFNDNGIAHNALGSFNPGLADFAVCVGFWVNDTNGVNMVQCGTNSVFDGVHGYWKLTPWGVVIQGTTGTTHGYVPANVRPALALNGTGWHRWGFQRHRAGNVDTVTMFTDGKLQTTWTGNLGSVDTSTRSCSVGGKWYDANPDKPIGAEDMLNGGIAQLLFGQG